MRALTGIVQALDDPLRHSLGSGPALWLQFALATPVVLWGGWPFFQRAWASVVNRHLNMFTLIGLGTGASYLYSVFALLFPGMIPASFRGMGGELAVYFEPAAVIVTLVLLGQVLELRARSSSSRQSSRLRYGQCSDRSRDWRMRWSMPSRSSS